MHVLKAVLLAVAIFLLSALAASGWKMVAPTAVEAHPWIEQFALKTTLAGLSVVAMMVTTGGLAASGFRRPNAKVRWFPVWAPALGMGAAATVLVLAGGSRGLTGVFGSYGLAGVIFWIWFYSSVTEEIFVRGWFQTYVAQRGGPQVAASALLFGAMHLGLIRRIDPWAVTVIVISAVLLGSIAARLRQKYESLLPAIVAHVCFNIGGAIGGAIFTIGYRLKTGHLPVM